MFRIDGNLLGPAVNRDQFPRFRGASSILNAGRIFFCAILGSQPVLIRSQFNPCESLGRIENHVAIGKWVTPQPSETCPWRLSYFSERV